MYHYLSDAMDNEEIDTFNIIADDRDDNNINKDYLHKANLLREKHRELRDGYDKLYRLAAKGNLDNNISIT